MTPAKKRAARPRAAPPSEPAFFATPRAFRAWLQKHHAKSTELLVGFHKVESGVPSITWKESVDEALCFGWIDGVRRRLDESSYCIRFTPRRPESRWSAVNIRRFAELEAEGRIRPAGRRAFAARSEKRSRTYSYEQARAPELGAAFERQLAANRKAAAFFRSQAPSYQRKVTHWVASAAHQATRERRLERLISAFEQGRRP